MRWVGGALVEARIVDFGDGKLLRGQLHESRNYSVVSADCLGGGM